MNNPRVFLIAFFVSIALLVTLLMLKPQRTPERLLAVVTSQTLTQSLDGQRKYLNVTTESGESLLIPFRAQLDCPESSKVTIEKKQGFFSGVVSYTVLECKQ
ncbi:hypothetical protein [Vibrio sinaloensis]|uniref:hypothetical protein n=1 Tax=Photobacterium sp. (strain ATCC 43367) TaxID=379097 RepID=UPI0035E95464